MQNTIKLGLVVFVLGLILYSLTNDLRWIYAGVSGAAMPTLFHLIWRERISLQEILRQRKK